MRNPSCHGKAHRCPKLYWNEQGFAFLMDCIPPDKIDPAEADPVSVEQRSQLFATMMKRGQSLPQIFVKGKRFNDDTYMVYDGHARVLAAKKAGLKCIEATVQLVKPDGRPIYSEKMNELGKEARRLRKRLDLR